MAYFKNQTNVITLYIEDVSGDPVAGATITPNYAPVGQTPIPLTNPTVTEWDAVTRTGLYTVSLTAEECTGHETISVGGTSPDGTVPTVLISLENNPLTVDDIWQTYDMTGSQPEDSPALALRWAEYWTQNLGTMMEADPNSVPNYRYTSSSLYEAPTGGSGTVIVSGVLRADIGAGDTLTAEVR